MPTENNNPDPDLNPHRPIFATSVETQTMRRYLEEHSEVGTIVPYNDLMRLFYPEADDAACKEHLRKLRGSLRSARNALKRDKQIHFHTITGQGLRRSDDHQIVGSVKQGLRTAHRKVRRESNDLAIVQFDRLDSNSKTETLVLQAQLGAANLSLSFSTQRKFEQRVLSGVRLELSGDVLQLFREQRC